jgi:superoxide dismutase
LVENGIPGLFTKEAFKVAYLEYQQLMMDELKACTAGMPSCSQPIMTARSAM